MKNIDKETLKKDFKAKYLKLNNMVYNEGSDYSKYEALGALVADYMSEIWHKTNEKYKNNNFKQVYYFSMEFLLGRLLSTNLDNLGIRSLCKEALLELGINLDTLESLENDQGLGNGGLGRLAACFMDSMASLNVPGHGCGIRYKYGFFEQKVIDNQQVELPENWLKYSNVWEKKRSGKAVTVKFGGYVDIFESAGKTTFVHKDYDEVLAVPYDTPIAGYRNDNVNTLRLWSAEALKNEFDYKSFSKGNFLEAIEYKESVEAISKVLYPDDTSEEGKILRLKQQYFFVSAGIQSIIRKYKKDGNNIKNLDRKIAIHINDTHPALAIPELMRILMDEEGFGWEEAMKITVNTVSYTNHTILSEALEKWSVDIFKALLPRIYMIVEEMNRRFCEELWNKYIGQWQKISDMAIIAGGYVRMAHLSIVGSHSVNGVAKLHTEILKNQEMANFHEFYPGKFNNKTNGITHRRWLLRANPRLTNLLKETIGDSFIKHPTDLEEFEGYINHPNVKEELANIKRENKIKLASYIKDHNGIIINPDSIFDVQVKRIHAYKRQVLNLFHIMDLYHRLLDNPNLDIEPRTFIFAGKAAPSYYFAKKVITLINIVAEKINKDTRIKDKLKVVFLENYRVSLAEKIIPATDISEQISTTTKEASGTSNMKFMMNGAVTIATLDGANIEIADEVGPENILIFGLEKQEVLNLYKHGGYNSREMIDNDERLQRICSSLIDGSYSMDHDEFRIIYESLVDYNDEFFLLKDFDSYVKTQNRVNELYRNKNKWLEMSGINIAHSGIFSSDRTIMEYASGIWGSASLYKNL